MNKKGYSDRTIERRRVFALLSIFFISMTMIVGRTFYLTIIKHEDYGARAENQWTLNVEVEAKRGNILDRNGREFATSANIYRVDCDIKSLREYATDNNISLQKIAEDVSKILELDYDTVYKKISNTKFEQAMLKRRVEQDVVDKLNSLDKEKKTLDGKEVEVPVGYYGIVIGSDTKRYYPNNNFLSHVLGYTNDNGGALGVELQYNDVLKGIPGMRLSEADRYRQDLPYSIAKMVTPIPGKDVVLTIDEIVQRFAEQVAKDTLQDTKAKEVRIMVTNPNNGEILAMVNMPDFNPNDGYDNTKSSVENNAITRNRLVSDAYEPGSIFKVFTAIAAMSEGKVSLNDTFYCSGSFTEGGRIVHCWKSGGHGSQNFLDILKNSCNVGFHELGLRLGPEGLNKYIYNLELNKATGIDLPGETVGIAKKTSDMTNLDLSIISFGQVNSMSALEYIKGFNAIANGGTLITPHIMKEISHYDSAIGQKVVDKSFITENKKVLDLDEETCRELRMYLEKVVSEGGGKKAYVEGYTIAGKTGTAQKISKTGRGYEQGKYISTFVGMVPADNPQLTLYLSIDEPDPSNYYAGQIAAPAARELFLKIFNHYAINPTQNPALSRSLLQDIIVPEIRGLSKDDAILKIKESRFIPEVQGDGEYVVDMNPKPGSKMTENSKIILYTSNDNNYSSIVLVPKFIGMDSDKAKQVAEELGFIVELNGIGIITGQNIESGIEVGKGVNIILTSEEIYGD